MTDDPFFEAPAVHYDDGVRFGTAGEMIAEIKGYAVLTGARGATHADVDALADAIVRLSALALDLKDVVAELDINPLFVFPQGQGVKAGDALIKPVKQT